MKIINENMKLVDFPAWSGAKDTKKTIIENNMAEDFDAMIEELYPGGLINTELNDILWFEFEWIYESLGIDEE